MDTSENKTVFQPHDHFFRVVLAPETTGNFLRERLPPEMVALLAADPPELVHGSLIDGELKEHLTDRLYRVRLPPPLCESYSGTMGEGKSGLGTVATGDSSGRVSWCNCMESSE
ncbi:MAG: Rpn family recombination-promoting nuclease/putative transposase [Magnetococcales bacterium]|nr:Rpn family recombination-promoting nuclease/putative transposase [Magnetococcales bacterium]